MARPGPEGVGAGAVVEEDAERAGQGNWCRYVAEMHLRAGRRLRAARRYGLAVRHGRRSAWRLTVASLASPPWTVRRLRERRQVHLPLDWALEVEEWLALIRAGAPVAEVVVAETSVTPVTF